ncbi:2Fe-2S iron-sulfur cluster-binding protein [Algiphilus aromaticivorans]|uniref:2Fe-2S iron-sulfur cluster-binding protein n=1 Tax=Algiphilus aromaticivorans TaxID=382454 RepID=UPI0005C21BA1|nr:2Fe-2S iron-sulfur cluster-binding protein [Algiphilus aromaticivorans]
MTHQVYLGDSGRSFSASPDQSLLEAGLAAGVPLPYGCSSGSCGACRCRLAEGSVQEGDQARALSDAERTAGYVLLCQARARSDIRLDWRAPATATGLRPATWPVRLQSRDWLSEDVLRVMLKLPRGEQTFDFLPGQYIDFLLEDGGRRSFSLAAPPNSETLELHVKVTPDGRFGRLLAEGLPERAMLRFEGPLGAFYLHDDGRPLVLVAGGTGFAPIKAIIEGALGAGDRRPMHLFWGAREPADLYQESLVARWQAKHPGLSFTPVCSDAGADWPGARGLVHEQLAALGSAVAETTVYVSGPPAMVAATKEHVLSAGLDPDHLHYDSFDDAHVTWPEKP